MTYKVHKSKSTKILENRGSLNIRGKQNKTKNCKLLVNPILELANHCSYEGYFVTTIERK